MNVPGLVKKAKKGDKEALLGLIMAEQGAYYRLAYSYMGNKTDALDALEDMIVTLYEKIHLLKKDDSFFSWSKTILVNRCKTMLRKRKKIVYLETREENQVESKEVNQSNPYVISEQQMDLNQLLTKLNKQQAEAIRLRYFHDLDYQTIAKITGVSLGTVKSRIHQGLNKLNSLYGGEYHE